MKDSNGMFYKRRVFNHLNFIAGTVKLSDNMPEMMSLEYKQELEAVKDKDGNITVTRRVLEARVKRRLERKAMIEFIDKELWNLKKKKRKYYRPN